MPPNIGLSNNFFYYFDSVEDLISCLVSFWMAGSFWLIVMVAGFISCGGPKKLLNIVFVSSPVLGYNLLAGFWLKRSLDDTLEPNKLSDLGFTLD